MKAWVIVACIIIACCPRVLLAQDIGHSTYIYYGTDFDPADWILTGDISIVNGDFVVTGPATATIGDPSWVTTGFRIHVQCFGEARIATWDNAGQGPQNYLGHVDIAGGMATPTVSNPITLATETCTPVPYGGNHKWTITYSARYTITWRELWVNSDYTAAAGGIYCSTTVDPIIPFSGQYRIDFDPTPGSTVIVAFCNIFGDGVIPVEDTTWSDLKAIYR